MHAKETIKLTRILQKGIGQNKRERVYSEPPKKAKENNQRDKSVERTLGVSDRKTNSVYKRTPEKGSGQGQHSIEDSNDS